MDRRTHEHGIVLGMMTGQGCYLCGGPIATAIEKEKTTGLICCWCKNVWRKDEARRSPDSEAVAVSVR